MARALFGVDNPGGKLPYTVYANLDGVPPQNEYDVSKGYTYQYFKGVPLYPFGHGLSYTRFRFSNLTLSAREHRDAPAEVQVAFDVTNVGDRAGDEVAQLYTHQLKSRSYQPIRTLRAFRRVTLEPKETTRVTFTLPASQLAWYQGGTIGSAVEPGVFDIGVGASSDNIRLRAHADRHGGAARPPTPLRRSRQPCDAGPSRPRRHARAARRSRRGRIGACGMGLREDLRYAWRALAAAPGVAVAAILSLALGIGANTAIFSVASPLLLSPLPYADPIASSSSGTARRAWASPRTGSRPRSTSTSAAPAPSPTSRSPSAATTT